MIQVPAETTDAIMETVLHRMHQKDLRESCGFIFENFDFFFAKNLHRQPITNYKIGLLDKLRAIKTMWKTKTRQFIVFHTHSMYPYPSRNDIEFATPDSYHMIFCYPFINLYRVILLRDGSKEVEKVWERVYGSTKR